MAQSDLTRVIEPACQKLAEQHGFELVDVELVREGGCLGGLPESNQTTLFSF